MFGWYDQMRLIFNYCDVGKLFGLECRANRESDCARVVQVLAKDKIACPTKFKRYSLSDCSQIDWAAPNRLMTYDFVSCSLSLKFKLAISF